MAVYKSKNPTKDGRSYYFMLYKKDNMGINKKYRSKKYKTKSEAKDAEAEFILKRDNPTHIKLGIVAIEFFKYLSTIKKESTLYTYRKDYNNHIAPNFNEMDILDINISNVKNWAENMNKKGLSTSYKNKIYNIFKLILDYAMKYYGLSVNCVNVYGRFQEKKDKILAENRLRYITYDEFNKFISVIDDIQWKTFFTFAFYTGCRKGEIFALTWNDINFNTNMILINKTLNEEIKGKYVITSTKNNILRKIQMSKTLIEVLKKYKQEMMKYTDFKETWFVFGGPVHLSKTSVDRYKHKYFELSGIKEITMHEFRHSHVSLLINEYIKSGQTDTTKFFLMMSDRMGHTIDVMQKTYMHLFPTVQNEIVDILNNL